MELGANGGSDEIDRTPPVVSGCAIGTLARSVPSGTRVERISRAGARLIAKEDAELLVTTEPDCLEIEQGQASFVID